MENYEDLDVHNLDLNVDVEDVGNEDYVEEPTGITNYREIDYIPGVKNINNEAIVNYVTLFITIFFISILFLQNRLIILIFKRFINLDKKMNFLLAQAISIALLSTYSVYHIK